jgi:hypothetical protein
MFFLIASSRGLDQHAVVAADVLMASSNRSPPTHAALVDHAASGSRPLPWCRRCRPPWADASDTGRPAPMAAAMGSSIR